MFQITKGQEKTLDEIAKIHSQNILRESSSVPGEYETDSIIERLNEVLKRTQGKSRVFFLDLKANDYSLLKEILVARPNRIEEIVMCFKSNIVMGLYPEVLFKQKGRKQKKFGDYISFVFNYTKFTKKTSYWNAYKLAELLGINVCVYCNRNFTYTISKGTNKIIRPEFDHFLPKSKYPFLAISIFNLIPSCHTCNSNLKGVQEFSVDNLHPYVESFYDYMRFTIMLKSKQIFRPEEISKKFGVNFFFGKLDSFEVELIKRNVNTPDDKFNRANNNSEIFKLKEIYNCHKDLVIDMIHNAIIYNDEKIDELLKAFHGTLFRNRDDVIRHITKNFHLPEDMPNRIFSAFTKDIHAEFGIKY